MNGRGRRPAACAAGWALTLALLLVACAGPAPPSGAPPRSEQAHATATSVPTSSPAIRPDQPYAGSDILAAMQASRRPGGVPDVIETEAIAARVAESLWTWDGRPWAQLAIGAACGETLCSLDVAGSPDATTGTDLYSFSIEPGSGTVELIATSLHGLPDELLVELDQLARAELTAGELEGLQLLSVRWLPPPDAGRYWLAYRSGGEEKSPGLDVLVDADARSVVETATPGSR